SHALPSSFLCPCAAAPPTLPPFPTRRSSDLHMAEKDTSNATNGSAMSQRFHRSDTRSHNATPSPVSTKITAMERRWVCVIERVRSEEHTSELQSRVDLVCRLLLEKKKKNHTD